MPDPIPNPLGIYKVRVKGGNLYANVTASIATSTAFGLVKPDNSTITINGGVISSAAASVTKAFVVAMGVAL